MLSVGYTNATHEKYYFTGMTLLVLLVVFITTCVSEEFDTLCNRVTMLPMLHMRTSDCGVSGIVASLSLIAKAKQIVRGFQGKVCMQLIHMFVYDVELAASG